MLLLVTLLITPGLLGLMMLMWWLEQTFTQQEVADEIAELLDAEHDPDSLDEAVARVASPLFPGPALPRRD